MPKSVAALSMTAAGYARVMGANDRISIAVIGCGGRGFRAHMPGVHQYAESENLEITAVCDPWRMRRERAAAQAQGRTVFLDRLRPRLQTGRRPLAASDRAGHPGTSR